ARHDHDLPGADAADVLLCGGGDRGGGDHRGTRDRASFRDRGAPSPRARLGLSPAPDPRLRPVGAPRDADAAPAPPSLSHPRGVASGLVTMFRISEAAELLGVSADTVRRWIDGGRLAASR